MPSIVQAPNALRKSFASLKKELSMTTISRVLVEKLSSIERRSSNEPFPPQLEDIPAKSWFSSLFPARFDVQQALSRFTEQGSIKATLPSQRSSVTVLLIGEGAQAKLREFLKSGTELHVIAPPKVLASIEGLGKFSPWAASNLNEINWCLKMIGLVDRIVVTQQESCERHQRLFNRIFLHLRNGGIFVFEQESLTSDKQFELLKNSLLNLNPSKMVTETKSHSIDRLVLDPAVATYVSRVQTFAAHLTIEKCGHHVLVVRDHEANRVIQSRTRTGSVRELHCLPASSYTREAKTTSHFASVPIKLIGHEIHTPELKIRVYEGDVSVVAQMLALHENTVIPESFRFHMASTLRNTRLKSVTRDFSMIQNNWNYRWKHLSGTYFHVDCENSGHFGHLVTEVLSHLWGWEHAKKEYPDLKLLFRIRHPGEREPHLEKQIFEAYGIARDDIVWSPVPVKLDRLVATTPQWHNQFTHYADRRIQLTWNRLCDSLVGKEYEATDKIFVSRRELLSNRCCRNAREVDNFFRKRGFQIIFPEEHISKSRGKYSPSLVFLLALEAQHYSI